MNMNKISFPPDSKNVKVVRKFAYDKGLSLRKVRNSDDLWNLVDPQTGKHLVESENLMYVHDYLCHIDD